MPRSRTPARAQKTPDGAAPGSEKAFLASLEPLTDARKRALKAHIGKYASADDATAFRLLGELRVGLWPVLFCWVFPLWCSDSYADLLTSLLSLFLGRVSLVISLSLSLFPSFFLVIGFSAVRRYIFVVCRARPPQVCTPCFGSARTRCTLGSGRRYGWC